MGLLRACMVTPLPPSRGPSQRAEAWAGPAARPYSQRSTGRRGGPAEGARRTRPSWLPSCPAGACNSARSGGWRCCSGCGCSRSPSGQRRSALWDQHRPPLQVCPCSCPQAATQGSHPVCSLAHAPRHHTEHLRHAQCCSRHEDRAWDRQLHGGAHSAEGAPTPRHKATHEGAPERMHREARWSRRSGLGRQDLGLPPSPDRMSPWKPHTHMCALSAPGGRVSEPSAQAEWPKCFSTRVSVTARYRPP